MNLADWVRQGESDSFTWRKFPQRVKDARGVFMSWMFEGCLFLLSPPNVWGVLFYFFHTAIGGLDGGECPQLLRCVSSSSGPSCCFKTSTLEVDFA